MKKTGFQNTKSPLNVSSDSGGQERHLEKHFCTMKLHLGSLVKRQVWSPTELQGKSRLPLFLFLYFSWHSGESSGSRPHRMFTHLAGSTAKVISLCQHFFTAFLTVHCLYQFMFPDSHLTSLSLKKYQETKFLNKRFLQQLRTPKRDANQWSSFFVFPSKIS